MGDWDRKCWQALRNMLRLLDPGANLDDIGLDKPISEEMRLMLLGEVVQIEHLTRLMVTNAARTRQEASDQFATVLCKD